MRARGGFVLIAVMWLMVAVSIVLLDLSLRLKHQRLTAINIIDRIYLRAAAEGAAAKSLLSLTAIRENTPLNIAMQIEDQVYTDSIGDVAIDITITDAQSRFNPNNASPARTSAFLTQFLPNPDQIAANIQAWIDSDSMDADGTPENLRYEGMLTRPKNRAIETPAEICGVAGIPSSACGPIATELSTQSDGRVNVNTARKAAVMSLPGLTPSAVEALLREQSANRYITSLFEFSNTLNPEDRATMQRAWLELQRLTTVQTTFVEIQIVARAAGLVTLTERLLVDVSGVDPVVARRYVF